MALITDTDFLIHSLRLSYLREVEDPYGPRLISLDPSYASNPYVVAASLADGDRWPELSIPSSPQISEDEAERPSGFPGARLKYTHTIMPDKPGGIGIRVNGKRVSTSKRMSGIENQAERESPLRERPSALSTTPPVAPADEAQDGLNRGGDETTSANFPQLNVQIQAPTAVEETPMTKATQFVPRFAGAEEMEARRRARLAARRMPAPGSQPLPSKPDADFSSSEEEADVLDDSSSDFGDQGASIDDADEFDPDFAATRTAITYESASDFVSDASTSMSNTSAPVSSSHTNGRQRPRLSPVEESSNSRQQRTSRLSIDNNFVMATAAPVDNPREKYYPPRRLDAGANAQSVPRKSATPSVIHTPHLPVPPSNSSDLTFARKKVGSATPITSTLSAMMASSGTTNPFSELYAAVSGRGEMAATNVTVYFPHATEPAGTPMVLNVKKDAIVEEVIGFALWTYWEEKWIQKLDEGLSGEDDPKWDETLSTVRWVLRIAELDGEVDDDFPPPDRMGKITRFNSEAYAIIEATPTQVEQNRVIFDKFHKRLDKLTLPGPSAPSVAASVTTGSAIGSVSGSSFLGPTTGHGPQILLRIRIAEHADAVHVYTTIPVSAGMYLQEALELVCRKRRQMDPKDYALLLGDQSLLIPLDRTVASLQGKRELLLVKRSMLPQYGDDIARGIGKTTDPNASIFKRMSETPEVQFAPDYTSAYKKYTIYRRMPMLVAKQERTLAIDGVYVHIMPSNRAKAVFDTAKTTSHHINSIVQCKQSTKMTSLFKLILSGRAGNKRYDFEAESPKVATEIVSTINSLKNALERSGTVNRSRRSKQMG